MAEEGSGGTKTSSEIEAIESLDTQLAKRKELLKLQQEDAALMRDKTAQLQIQADIQKNDLTLQSQKIKALSDEKEIVNELNAEQKAVLGTIRAEAALQGKDIDLKTEALRLIAKQRAELDQIKDASKQTEKFIGGLAGKLGIATKFSETTAGGFADMAVNLAQTGNAGEIFSSAISTTLNPLNIMSSLLETMAESIMLVALGADKAASNFQRATGFSGEIQADLIAISQSGVASGVSLEDAGKAMGSLANNFSAFNPTANETNIELSNTITLLEKTGVSADQSAKTMDFFNKVMGESPKAAADLTTELALAGTGIGVSTSKMLSDFESVNGYLIGFGDRTTEVFLELQAQSKATGIAVSSLVGIAQKFDTFDGAANAVGSLNAALGTSLSTIDMLNMSTEQRISMLAQEIDFASGGFENLDRYTQMYVAQTLGVKDAGEAQRLLNLHRNPAELSKYNAEMQASAARQDELKSLTQDFVPFMEQLEIAIRGLGLALAPLVSVVTAAIAVFGDFVGFVVNLGVEAQILASALALVMAAVVSYKVFAMISAAWSAATAAAAAFTPANLALALSQELQGDSQAKQALLNSKSAPVLKASSKSITAAMIEMAPALGIAALAMLAVSSAFFIAAHAVKTIVPPMKELFIMFRDNLSVIPEMALVLLAFGSSFLLSGAMMFAGSTLMASAIIPLTLVGLALGFMITPIERLGAGFAAMGTGIQMAAAGISPLITGLSKVLELTDDDGFFAVTTDGSKTSMVSAKGGVLSSFTSENISVDVKIPEIKVPAPIVHVYIDGAEIKKLVKRTMANVNGG